MAMFPPTAGERKKGIKKEDTYWKGEAELLEDRAYDYGCNSSTPLRDAVDSLKRRIHPPTEQYIT